MARSAKDWAVTKLDYRFSAMIIGLMALDYVLSAILAAQAGNWLKPVLTPVAVVYLVYLARGLWRTRP